MNIAGFARHSGRFIAEMIRTRRPRSRVAVVKRVWDHHSARSGYQPIAHGLGVVVSADGRFLPRAITRRLERRYGRTGLDGALQVAGAARLMRRDTILIIDGDYATDLINDLRVVFDGRVFAVFHQIPSVLQERFAASPALPLDGIICVARCQEPFVRHLVGPGRVWFIPHGVDTHFFCPGPAAGRARNVLCVGVHRRDFATLDAAAAVIRSELHGTAVRLVAPRAYLPDGLRLEHVELLSGLSEHELREAYRSASVVLLPLTASTANNTLLEAIACGCAVVVTDVEGVTDYVDAESAVLCRPGDAAQHAHAVIELVRNTRKAEALRAAARARSERFAWSAIRRSVGEVLNRDAPDGARRPAVAAPAVKGVGA